MLAAAQSSVSEDIYRRIKGDIILAELRPSQKLKPDRLRRDYPASISTLRELLSRLVSEGFVSNESQRGFAVAPVSAADLRELADMRLFLEGSAIERAFKSGDLDWEGRVVAAHHKLTRAEEFILGGDPAALSLWKSYDREFHHALISACGSEELLDAHADIYDKYLRYQMVVGIYRGEIVATEHAGLLDCALRRDADGARRILTTHINDCVDAIVACNALC